MHYTIRQLPSGNYRTQVRYTDKDGNSKRKSITAPTEWEVMKLADDFRKGIDYSKEHITVHEAIAEYINNRKSILADSTKYGYEIIAKNRLQKIKNYDIFTIKKGDIQAAIDFDAARGLRYKSIREALSLLKSALRDKEVEIPPIKKFTLPAPKQKKQDIPKIENVLDVIIP